MTFVFTPGPPKKAQFVTPQALRALVIGGTSKPESAKRTGDGSVKVFMSGPLNYYTTETPSLRHLLARYGITL